MNVTLELNSGKEITHTDVYNIWIRGGKEIEIVIIDHDVMPIHGIPATSKMYLLEDIRWLRTWG